MDCCRETGPTGKEMADDTIEQELPDCTDASDSGDQSDNTPEQAIVSGIWLWVVASVIVTLCAGAGLVLGRLFAGSREPERAAAVQTSPLLDLGLPTDQHPAATGSSKTWYYDLDPVTVNLNEPNFARHIRAAITLEIDDDADPSEGRAFLDQKKLLLKDRLTVYLASLNSDNLRGHENLEQVRGQILDLLNSELFPDSEPRIRQILLRQLAISISLDG